MTAARGVSAQIRVARAAATCTSGHRYGAVNLGAAHRQCRASITNERGRNNRGVDPVKEAADEHALAARVHAVAASGDHGIQGVPNRSVIGHSVGARARFGADVGQVLTKPHCAPAKSNSASAPADDHHWYGGIDNHHRYGGIYSMAHHLAGSRARATR